ncbi:MAG: hypothetical protein E6Q83_02910 [Thiothrix sp.]|nr:MAG: hypothetical protein E6Q83_02910 [Thiothrix sp.]
MLRLRTIAWLMSLSWLAMLPVSLAAKPAPAPANLIKVYKYQGSLQCQGGGEPLAKMRRQLIKRGVKVLAGQCGVDGLIYPAVCGAPDGHINIFTIQRQSLVKAQSQGFDLLRNLPDAQVTYCKPAP